MNKLRRFIIVALIVAGFCILLGCWFLFHHSIVHFTLIGQMDGQMSFRTSDNRPFDPQGWVWYSVCENPYSGFDSREIQVYLDQNDITLDTANYSYIIVRGYTLKELSYTKWNSTLQEGYCSYTGYVKLSSDCEPSMVNIYQIEKMLIVPSRQYSTSAPFVLFE